MSKHRCTEKVWSKGVWASHRCPNTAKFDPDAQGVPTKCGTHSAASEARRKAKQDAKMQKWMKRSDAARDLRQARADVESALRKIAEGHNDPRSLAQETIAALDAAIERAEA